MRYPRRLFNYDIISLLVISISMDDTKIVISREFYAYDGMSCSHFWLLAESPNKVYIHFNLTQSALENRIKFYKNYITSMHWSYIQKENKQKPDESFDTTQQQTSIVGVSYIKIIYMRLFSFPSTFLFIKIRYREPLLYDHFWLFFDCPSMIGY